MFLNVGCGVRVCMKVVCVDPECVIVSKEG